jgi:copper chaperone CopZ
MYLYRIRRIPMASLKLRITGMTCAHCQMSVEKALAKVPGVYGAVVDLRNASAEVDYDDDAATIEELTAAVAKAGYAAAVDG